MSAPVPPDPPPHSVSSEPVLDPEATVDLLQRARGGDRAALDRLLARCLPPLRRWAHGRLPPFARDLLDTADVVQDTVIAALGRLDGFEARREGALQAYLRQAVANRITDVVRQHLRRPIPTEMPEHLADAAASPLERAIGAENQARYDEALARLREEDREAIVTRIELQYSYEELAVALGKPTANAARVAVTRALQRLAAEMRQGPDQTV
jgi:RNA polymerase sigma-70 factor (ECF subfamily)